MRETRAKAVCRKLPVRVRNLGRLPGPDDVLGGERKVAAGDVWWRIGFGPCHDVQDFVTTLCELPGDGEDVVVGAANPYTSVLFQLLAAQAQPSSVEIVHFVRCAALVPLAFVYTDYPSALHAYSTVGQEVRRVGKYEVELEVELGKEFQAVAMKQGESAVGGTVVRGDHRQNFNSRHT